MKKIIVTGSCGFIGYNLINSLSHVENVIGIDSLNNAYDNNLKKLRLENLNNLENFKYLQFIFCTNFIYINFFIINKQIANLFF